ncbi:MAG: ABC transporter ATP-binding protein [Proteobacteria bacterium]|nr:ABC transporter ATP-binding protein [Pseudomonadota bacterium]
MDHKIAKPEKLLRVHDLSVSFKTGDREVEAVRHISFELNAGETLALVGESGSGKSVTALSIMQLLPYPMASHPSGSIEYRGRELIGADAATLKVVRGDQIGMTFQEPMTALNPLHTIEKQISEVLILHQNMSAAEARIEVISLLEKVKIRDPEHRLSSYPHQLSGGQRQRVMIAMALANKPEILIADEPTTALDVTVQAEILELLNELQASMGMAILLITHDLAMVEKFADKVAVMRAGELMEQGATGDLFSAPAHPYTKMLLDAEPGVREVKSMQDLSPVISCDDLKVWFPVKKGVLRRTVDYIKAVDGVSLRILEGRTLGVVGESGSGKTTLALALLRLIHSEGQIKFDGGSIDGLNSKQLKEIRPRMQMVFQDPYGSLSPRLTITEIVEEGLQAHDIGNERSRQQDVISMLEEVGVDPASRNRYPHEFSGGQRQRIAIARAMIMRPKLVVLDEPTSALDRTVQGQIVDLLERLQSDHDLAYLFISHDLSVVRALSDEILVLQQGKLVEYGPASQVFESPEQAYTRRLIAAATEFKAGA